jgi:hypothetical protein
MQFNRPFVLVIQIQPPGLHFQHPQNIPPLPVRDFVAQAVPFEFSKEIILGRSEISLLFWIGGKNLLIAPLIISSSA